ncbi:hypothetical protein NDA16_003165 [Ustilago loliicola]|nr:hypothetical protein NDA16_003165 [Ustilago loliicola]
MEYILAHPQGLGIDPGLPPTSAGELDRKYAHILHFRGVPVYNVHTTDLKDLQQALVDYDHVYVYGRMQGSREKSVIQVFSHKAPVITPPGSDILLKKVAFSRDFEAIWGPQIRALVDGRPIQRMPSGSRDQNIFFAGRGHHDLNLYCMRDALAKSGSLSIYYTDTDNVLELTLDRSGLAKLVSTLEPAELAHPRVIKRADTIGYYEHGSAAYPKLSKRMYSGSSSQVKPFEHYVGHHFQVGQDTTGLTPEQVDADFAEEIHYDRTPILFPGQVPESKVRQAIHSYGKTWIVGRPSNLAGDLPLQYVHLEKLGVLNSHGWDQVSRHLGDANEFESSYGKIPKYLRYGRPFSPREGSGIFNRYKKPSWDKVKQKGTLFHLGRTDLPHVRAHLNANNYLKAFDRERNKLYGFALDKTGKVLFNDFGKYHL